jgi:predicted O-methyltransferase YrrM
MRSFRHWSPRYLKNRIAEIYYHKSSPDLPWLTRTANEILASYLKESDIGLEFGSGRSTIWFAKRIRQLTSVEDDEGWYRKVRQLLESNDLQNVDYHFIPKNKEDDDAADADYVKIMERIETNSVDLVLVDGSYRDFCALKALRVIRPGGVLIIDNVNWFLPCNSYSPASRSEKLGPKGRTWEEVHRSISRWRKIWTTSGVTDTAFFFKPDK